MNENILSYIWQFQYFDARNLATEDKQALSILRTGFRNRNAGPDFLEARLMIAGVQWIGSVEIHVRSSDWYQHAHDTNDAYEGVVLHVVWEDDGPVSRRDGTLLPCLALKKIADAGMIDRYRQLQDDEEVIPCHRSFGKIGMIHKYAMLDRVLLERLDRKASEVMQLYHQARQDWDTTAYQWIGKHYGFKLNDPVFLRLTEAVPWKVVRKHRHNLLQVESLLFGGSGMLMPEYQDDYCRQLLREFGYLKSKYRLTHAIQMHEWKFARLRPAGFPTVRLAQFARLICSEPNLFSMVVNAPSHAGLQSRLAEQQSDYWTSHYVFEKTASGKVPAMGKGAVSMLIINAMVPLLVAYARQKQQSNMLDRAMDWLSQIAAEDNYIIRQWADLDMQVKTAADSQALIEWHHHYCVPKRCLECTVGAALVRNA
ncbi:DUF2851 family protein [Dyadobacter sandarakinus]|uniref:DUF2851 family protein n=1 Tax=Dyadobacter sandarakinus TaxID=2747268 RepID=A0ABX7I5N2_9BACT|nr:DUF2851 family protein [Dyadobacter sandarakinus]QRR01033.1 DUF2851 family protein [Dyadobacter sandarakinus]